VGGVPVVLPISTVAERLGISASTLRTWQRRYGLGASVVTAGGHRRYSPDDLLRLQAVHQLILDGVSAGDAARAVLAGPATDTQHASGAPQSLALAAVITDGLQTAALALDGAVVDDLVRTSIARYGCMITWETLLRPTLRVLGEQSERPECVAAEHLVSHVCATAFGDVASRSPAFPRQPTVLLACAPEEQHDLPLTALAASLAEQGIASRLLGARTPTSVLAAATAQINPVATVVFSLLEQNQPVDFTAVADTHRVAAGPGWQAEHLPVPHVNGLADAVELITTTVEPTAPH
jgi:DNA-binding transcriptional MerR regulator